MLSRDLQKTCKDCWDPPELALYSHLGLGCYRGKAAGVGGSSTRTGTCIPHFVICAANSNSISLWGDKR